MACSGVLAFWLFGLTGCGSAVSWEQAVDIEALARTWPKYQAPTYIDPSSPLVQVAGNDESPDLSFAWPNLYARPEVRSVRPPVKSRDDWDISEIVADSLGRIGKTAVPKVIGQLGDADPKKRTQAARIIAKIGPDAAAAVTDLTGLLKDDNEEVRKAAARALGQIGPAAENSVEALLDMMAN